METSTKLFFTISLVILILLSGCISSERKPLVKLSQGGVTAIGVKRYLEVNPGDERNFIYKLAGGKTYAVFLFYVDEVETKKKRKLGGGTETNTTVVFEDMYKDVDYDLVLKSKDGEIFDTSTQSAGLWEVIRFAPRRSGEYVLTVTNDPKESKGKWPVMLIATELYQEGRKVYMKGKDRGTSKPEYETYYSLFFPNNAYSSIAVIVPNSLDMYQARVLCLGDDDYWADALHKRYDPEKPVTSEEIDYRSFGKTGEDMGIELTKGDNCFLQLIAEEGAGELSFKTFE